MKVTKKQREALRRDWIKALRSKRFKQVKSELCELDDSDNPVGFCCLGVGCEVFMNFFPRRKLKVLSVGNSRTYDGQSSYMPQQVADAFGLSDTQGNFNGGGLAEMNDSGKRFSTIAKIIDSKPEGLFVA